VLLWEKDVK
jgi:hypothetical protein